LEWNSLVWGYPGDKLDLEIERDGKALKISVIRGDRQTVYKNWTPKQ